MTSATSFNAIPSRAMPTLPPLTRAGRSTSSTMVKMSSTTNQPSAVWPEGVCSTRLSSSTRVSTTVLATLKHTPNMAAAAHPQPVKA